MSVTVSSYQHPCILQLHLTISHVCNNCIGPYSISLTIAHNQQSRPLNLHILACMSDTFAPDQHSYSLNLCCLLLMDQTSIVVMANTIASDQQVCIVQFCTSSSDAFNSHTKPEDKIVTSILSLTRVFVLIHCTP